MIRALVAATCAEFTKLRSMRSTLVTLSLFFPISIGIGALEGWSVRGAIASHSPMLIPDFSAAQAGFDGVLIGQLALIVFSVLLVTSEYGSRMIGLSLLAVPRRGQFYAAKMIVVGLAAAVVAIPAVVLAYMATEFALGPYGSSPLASGVPRAMLGAVGYLTLMSVFAAGIAVIARNPIVPLATLLPLVLAGSQILSIIGATTVIARFLPDRAGMRMLAVSAGNSDQLSSVAGFAVMLVWAAAALMGGYLLLQRRDA
jgi:ABC-2 type transport system permease protein